MTKSNILNLKNNKPCIKALLIKLSALVPAVYAFSYCSPLGAAKGLVLCCLLALFAVFPDPVLPYAAGGVMLILYYLLFQSSPVLLLSVIIGEALFLAFGGKVTALLSSHTGSVNKFRLPLKIITAFCVTAIFTNYYFDIGATGATPVKMIVNYFVIGFHPNWRGILYGTIVLVLMITMRRKFKKAGAVCNFQLVALFVTTVLNFFLIPKGSISPIELTAIPSFEDFSLSFSFGDFGIYDIFRIFICSLLLFIFLCILKKGGVKLKFTAEGAISALLSPVIFALLGLFNGTPVASLGAMLIVHFWQGKLKEGVRG